MSDLENQAASVLQKMQEVFEQYTPAAYDAAISVARIEAISALFGGLVAMAIAVITVLYFVKTYKAAQSDPGSYGWKEEYFIAALVTGVIGAISIIVALCSLLSIINWVGVFNPELFLAYKLMN